MVEEDLMEKYTISDLLKDDRLRGMVLAAGGDRGKRNVITGVNVMDNPDTFDWLTAGEFIISTGFLFKDDTCLQVQIVKELAEINCSGLGIKMKRYIDFVPQCMIDEANRLGLAIIEIPFHYSLAQVYGLILSRVSVGGRDLLKQYLHIHNTITQCTLTGGDLSMLVKLVSSLISNPFFVVDEKWRLLEFSEHPDNPIGMKEYMRLRKGEEVFSNEIISVLSEHSNDFSKSIKRVIPGTQIVLRIKPVVVRQPEYGFLVVWETVHKMEAIDYLALEMAATSVAFERLKFKQIREARHQLRQDFFDDLLEGKIVTAMPVKSLAEIHKMDSMKSYICFVTRLVQSDMKGRDPMISLRTFQQFKQDMMAKIAQIAYRHSRNIVTIHRGSVLISFLQAEDKENDQISGDTREMLFEIYQAQTKVHKQVQIGVGRICTDFLQIRDSYLNALEAIEIAQRAKIKASVFYYEDLMVYHLLSGLDESFLESFRTQSLGKIIKYDAENNTKLIETLEAYFAHSGNVTKAAESSFLHRNTFIYRMKKIRELLEHDMENPEELLSLHIGLKANRILGKNYYNPRKQ